MLCYLCSIVNKILAHVILNYFSFHFIQIKVPIFPEFRLYIKKITYILYNPSDFYKVIDIWQILQSVCKILTPTVDTFV